MPLPVLPGVVRLSVAGDIDGGGRWSNTWHWRRTDLATADLSEMSALDNVVQVFYSANIQANQTVGSTMDSVDITPLDGSAGAVHFTSTAAGAGTGNAMPAEVAQVLTLRTALRGRRHRGRIFLPALSSGNYDANGRMASAVISNILAGVADMIADALTIGWELGVASYGRSVKTNYTVTPHTFLVTTWDPEFTVVTQFSMDALCDVIRSRKN